MKKEMKIMKSKRGQEEIIGFVMIVVIVAVIGLIFLVISLREKPSIERESKDIRLFLDSLGEYTSECAVNYEPDYSRARELLIECYNGKQCLSGKKACDVLKNILESSIESGYPYGEEMAIKGYFFNSSYSSNSSKEYKSIIAIPKGNCSSGIKTGAEEFISSYPGTISYSLELCY